MSRVSIPDAAIAGVSVIDVITIADLGYDQIVSFAAKDCIVSGTGVEHVVPSIAKDTIRACVAEHGVSLTAAKYLVIARTSKDDVAACRLL